jgi:hypothetical protein
MNVSDRVDARPQKLQIALFLLPPDFFAIIIFPKAALSWFSSLSYSTSAELRRQVNYRRQLALAACLFGVLTFFGHNGGTSWKKAWFLKLSAVRFTLHAILFSEFSTSSQGFGVDWKCFVISFRKYVSQALRRRIGAENPSSPQIRTHSHHISRLHVAQFDCQVIGRHFQHVDRIKRGANLFKEALFITISELGLLTSGDAIGSSATTTIQLDVPPRTSAP